MPDLDELVSSGDIAAMIDYCSPSSVCNWYRRCDDFPVPIERWGVRLWVRAEIVAWLDGSGGNRGSEGDDA